MTGNWDFVYQKRAANRVAIANFYAPTDRQMALVSVSKGYVGTIANFWCPIKHRNNLATRVAIAFPGYEVWVSHPLPDDGSAEWKEVFPPYPFS